MKILALDSSGQVATVALMEDGNLLEEITIDSGLTHSQTLLPMLDDLRRRTDLDLATIDAVAVAAGPGSFTGLRIGASTAKGIALALSKPIVPVPTVDALAFNLAGAAELVCPMMDARRNQVYTGIYRFEGSELIEVLAQCAVTVPEIAERLNTLGESVTLLGDGADAHREQLQALLRVPFQYAPAPLARQRASSVAALAERLSEQGKAIRGSAFSLEYLRLPQAERERLEREGQAAEAEGG